MLGKIAGIELNPGSSVQEVGMMFDSNQYFKCLKLSVYNLYQEKQGFFQMPIILRIYGVLYLLPVYNANYQEVCTSF